MKILALNKINSNLKMKRFKMPNAAYSNRYPALEKTKQNGKTKRNKKDCRPSNNTFGKLYPQANTSFAKRVISANVRSCANLKDEKS